MISIVQDALHNDDTEVLFNDILEQKVFPGNGASASIQNHGRTSLR
jgi:hypothetical protein